MRHLRSRCMRRRIWTWVIRAKALNLKQRLLLSSQQLMTAKPRHSEHASRSPESCQTSWTECVRKRLHVEKTITAAYEFLFIFSSPVSFFWVREDPPGDIHRRLPLLEKIPSEVTPVGQSGLASRFYASDRVMQVYGLMPVFKFSLLGCCYTPFNLPHGDFSRE